MWSRLSARFARCSTTFHVPAVSTIRDARWRSLLTTEARLTAVSTTYDGAVNTGQTIEKRDGMSVTTLVLGLVVLVLLLGAGGAGIGQVELAVWLAVVGWVALWWSKRRRPETIEKPGGMSVTTLILGLFVLVLLLTAGGSPSGCPSWSSGSPWSSAGWRFWWRKRRRPLR